jgi:hypothetical protein
MSAETKQVNQRVPQTVNVCDFVHVTATLVGTFDQMVHFLNGAIRLLAETLHEFFSPPQVAD